MFLIRVLRKPNQRSPSGGIERHRAKALGRNGLPAMPDKKSVAYSFIQRAWDRCVGGGYREEIQWLPADIVHR